MADDKRDDAPFSEDGARDDRPAARSGDIPGLSDTVPGRTDVGGMVVEETDANTDPDAPPGLHREM